MSNYNVNVSSMSAQGSGAGLLNSIYIGSPTVGISRGTSIGNSLFGSDNRALPEEVKKYEVYESPHDVLALSVAWKRLRDSKKPHSISKLMSRELFDHLEQSDILKANEIRDYYSKKIVFLKLKFDDLKTNFRKDLNEFIHTDGKLIRDQSFGMAYYLPEFYAYDMKLDKVKAQLKINQNFKKLNEKRTPWSLDCKNVKLMPLASLNRKTKRTNRIDYWLKDVDTGAGVLVAVDSKNVLLKVWDTMFHNAEIRLQQFDIEGKFTRKTLDEFEYFSVTDWSIKNMT